MFSYLKKIFPQSLQGRFLLIIFLPTIIAQSVIVYVFYFRYWSNISSNMNYVTVREMQLVLDAHLHDDADQVAKLSNFFGFETNLRKHQKLSSNKWRREEFKTLQEILDTQIPWNNTIRYSRSESIVKVSFEIPSGVLDIAMSSKRIIHPTTQRFIVWILGLTTFFLLVALAFTRNQIRSMTELSKAADNFGWSKDIGDFKPTGALEVRRAGKAFLRMKERIERQITKRTQMLAMISHDLKTPLTRIKLELEMLPDFESKDSVQKDIDYMKEILNSYLDFSRGEGGEEFKRINLSKYLVDIVAYEKIKNLTLTQGRIRAKLFANIKEQTFKRAIYNILSNAAKYATNAKIDLYTKQDQIFIDIHDNGPGIAEEHRINVFNAFYRVDQSRNMNSSASVGLGLAITKEIILGHNGYITLHKSEELGGLLARITLPIA